MHLRLLQMEARFRKAMKVADMVVMQMRQDDISDLIGVDINQLERIDRIAQERALALGRNLRGEAAIDDVGLFRRHRGPQEIIHRHRAVMRIAADEMIAPLRLARGVADGEQFVFRRLRTASAFPRAPQHFWPATFRFRGGLADRKNASFCTRISVFRPACTGQVYNNIIIQSGRGHLESRIMPKHRDQH